MAIVRFAGIVDTMSLAVTTPISADQCITRFNFRFKTMGDEETTRNVGRAFVREVDKQFLEDKPIWEHKAHLVRPALADNDGPFMKFRKWAAQFYAEPISDERTVFPPPWWPERADDAPAKATASARVRRLLTVLVDPPLWTWRERRWSHLVSDESYDELHAMADALGIERRWFQRDHYDVPEDYRERAIELGAVPVSSRELIRRLLDSGLRQRKPR